MAKYAYSSRGRIFLRIYRKGSDKLLAERLYYHGDKAHLIWLKDGVGYDTTGDDWPHDGIVHFPPTWIDRALTYLP